MHKYLNFNVIYRCCGCCFTKRLVTVQTFTCYNCQGLLVFAVVIPTFCP